MLANLTLYIKICHFISSSYATLKKKQISKKCNKYYKF